MGSGKQAQARNKIIPLATGALILLLGFFAFRNGFGSTPTASVTLDDTTFIGTFLINEQDISIPVSHTIVRFTSADPISFETGGREINVTGTLWLNDFMGTITSNGEQIIVKGTMDAAHGAGLDIAWSRREKSTLLLTNGVADVSTMNLSSLALDATGRITLEHHWTAQLNETPFRMSGFNGRVYVQRINNDSTIVLEGDAKSLSITQKNLLKTLA
jgi:hypothetical protein